MAGITLCVVLLRVFGKMADVIFHRGPLICSYVIQNLSWEFGFWFVSIPLGLNALAVLFFVPEVCLHALRLSEIAKCESFIDDVRP